MHNNNKKGLSIYYGGFFKDILKQQQNSKSQKRLNCNSEICINFWPLTFSFQTQ